MDGSSAKASYTIEYGEGLQTRAGYEALVAERDDLQARLDSTSALIEAAEKYRAAYEEAVTGRRSHLWLKASGWLEELKEVARQQPATPTGQGLGSAGQDSGERGGNE